MSRLLSALVVLVAVATSSTGYADVYAPVEPDAASIELEEVLRTAKVLARKGLSKRALHHFKVAYSIRVTYKSAGNLGIIELELGQHLNAYEHLLEALSVLPKDQQEVAEHLNGKLEEAKTHLFSLSIDVHPGAEVFLDGEKIGQAPMKPVMVDPGSHTVYAQILGFKSPVSVVVGIAGQRQGVSLTIDTQQEGSAEEGNGLSLPATVTIAGVSLTVASLAISIGLTVWANEVASDADELAATVGDSGCVQPTGERVAQCAELVRLLDERFTADNAAVGMWVTTGVITLVSGGAVVAALMLADSDGEDAEDAEEAPSVTFIPSIGAGHGGFTLVGTW